MPTANNADVLNGLSQQRKEKVLGGQTDFVVEPSTVADEQGKRTIAEPVPVAVNPTPTPAPAETTVEEAAKPAPKAAASKSTTAAKTEPVKASTKA